MTAALADTLIAVLLVVYFTPFTVAAILMNWRRAMNLDPLTLLTLATVVWWGRWLIGLARADWLPEGEDE